MAATNKNVDLSQFIKSKSALQDRLPLLYTEIRQIEEALGLPSKLAAGPQRTKASARTRINAPSRSRVKPPTNLPKGAPKGAILATVWDHIRKNPGVTASDICKALGMEPTPIGTALHTLKRNKQVRVKGVRGSYRYSVVAKTAN